jgi:hypothetical protein
VDEFHSRHIKWKVQQQAEAAGASLFDHFVSDEEKEKYYRVQEWCSNTQIADGNGGYCNSDEKDQIEDGALKIKYILSESAGGHGDDLWAASRHISNLLAQKEKCSELLKNSGRLGVSLYHMKIDTGCCMIILHT